MTKCCSKCKQDLPFELFAKNKSNKDGLQGWCKQCAKNDYLQKKESIIARVCAYQSANKAGKAAYDKQRRSVKGDELRAYDRQRNSLPHRVERSRQWQANNPEAVRAIKSRSARKLWKQSYTKHRAKYIKAAQNKRAIELNRIPSWFSEFDDFVLEEAIDLAILRSATLGFDWQLDHIVPLKGKIVCGLHVGINWQVIPRAVNYWKQNKLLSEPAPHFQRSI